VRLLRKQEASKDDPGGGAALQIPSGASSSAGSGQAFEALCFRKGRIRMRAVGTETDTQARTPAALGPWPADTNLDAVSDLDELRRELSY
jgi:hypothetical protein